MATAAERELERLTAALAATQARVEEESRLAASVLPPLSSDVLELIFLLVPCDSRLRCREVSRGWRAFLERTRLWEVCSLSPSSGVVARSMPALLRAASLRAGGQLRVLDLRVCSDFEYNKSAATALAVVATENASCLKELRINTHQQGDYTSYQLTEATDILLAAAPLCTLHADVSAVISVALRMLRNEAPYERLRISEIKILEEGPGGQVPALCDAASKHPSLISIWFQECAMDDAALDALASNAVLMTKLRYLSFMECGLNAQKLPSLTRLLSASSLDTLCLNNDAGLCTGPALPAFCSVLRACRLTRLELFGLDLFASLADGLSVLAACTAHPTLQSIEVAWNAVDDLEKSIAAGFVLAALVSCNPALETLDVFGCDLGSEGFTPLFEAVSRSLTLRKLDCSNEEFSAAFVRNVVLPAVQANTSLRTLVLERNDGVPEIKTAMALVKARTAAKS